MRNDMLYLILSAEEGWIGETEEAEGVQLLAQDL